MKKVLLTATYAGLLSLAGQAQTKKEKLPPPPPPVVMRVEVASPPAPPPAPAKRKDQHKTVPVNKKHPRPPQVIELVNISKEKH